VAKLTDKGINGHRKNCRAEWLLLQMFNHGLSASALFCFIGFLEERSGVATE